MTTGEIGGYSSILPVLLDRTISQWTAPPKIIDKILERECKELHD
jgi:tRNA(adenine34) deaminase